MKIHYNMKNKLKEIQIAAPSKIVTMDDEIGAYLAVIIFEKDVPKFPISAVNSLKTFKSYEGYDDYHEEFKKFLILARNKNFTFEGYKIHVSPKGDIIKIV